MLVHIIGTLKLIAFSPSFCGVATAYYFGLPLHVTSEQPFPPGLGVQLDPGQKYCC